MHWILCMLANGVILFSISKLLPTVRAFPTDDLPTAQTQVDSSTSSSTLEINRRSPVIIIPGMGGSRVEAKLNKSSTVDYWCKEKTSEYKNLWVDAIDLSFFIECLIDNLKLNYDNKTRTTSNSEGVDIRSPGWGHPLAVESLDPGSETLSSYFRDITNLLVEDLGYIRNVSLRAAPYDFRKGPNENEEYFLKLKDLIEETYAINNNQSVTLFGHSMGAPMALVFLQSQSQAWKDKYIKSIVAFAGTWGGTVRSLKTFAMGDDLGIMFLNRKVLKKLLRTFPSLGWSLPSNVFWKNDEVIVETQSRNYTFADLKQYLIDIGTPNAWEFYEDNEKYLQDFNPPKVEIHCLYGTGVDTVEKLLYKEGQSIQDDPTIVYGDGDGFVNLRILEGCKRWIGKQNHTVHNQIFPGVDHKEIVKDKNVLAYLKEVLK